MEDGVWRTVSGRRIFIKNGQSLTDAMKNSGKFKDKEKNKSKEKLSDNKTKKVLYHQTKANSLDEFNENKRQAGLSDTSTPKGIFLKDTDDDIGLEGKNQLKMEVEMKRPLTVANRDELKKIISSENERYKNIINNEGKTDDYYSKKNDELEAKIDTIYRKKYDAPESEKIKYQNELNKIYVEQDDLLDQWSNSGKNTGKIAQEEITRTLKGMGYDSLILEEDEGSYGRKVKSYIVFDIKQLKQLN